MNEPLDLDEIERLAKEATPGPWSLGHPGDAVVSQDWRGIYRDDPSKDAEDEKKYYGGYLVAESVGGFNRVYIAHMHPGRVRALVQRMRDSDTLVKAGMGLNAAYGKRIDELSEELSQIETALCTSAGLIIPDGLTNVERIRSLHDCLHREIEARATAEAALASAMKRIHEMSRRHADQVNALLGGNLELSRDLDTERRTANEALATEYDARKKAEKELDALRNTIHANTPVMGDCTTEEALRGILSLIAPGRDLTEVSDD